MSALPRIVRRAARAVASALGWGWLAAYIVCDELDGLERRWQRRRGGAERPMGGDHAGE